MATAQEVSVLAEAYAGERARVEERLTAIMTAARTKAVDELESYHAFGPKFTKFDDFEPLERQDGETTRRLEREAILSVEGFSPEVVDLKVDVFGRAAVATFVMAYDVAEPGGERHSFRARATMVFASEDGQWLIVHEHFSPFVANS
jgi:hypothetical protein